MNDLEGRAVVALGNHELLPALDHVDTEINRLESIRLQLVARIEESGHAQELGARDTRRPARPRPGPMLWPATTATTSVFHTNPA